MTNRIYRPTVLTLIGLATTIAMIAGTVGFIVGRVPMLREFVPVHFNSEDMPDRWLPASYALVLLYEVPILYQLFFLKHL